MATTRVNIGVRPMNGKPTVEQLNRTIEDLILARQELRIRGPDAEELERNRRELVAFQWKLAHALIERYIPQRKEQAQPARAA